MYIHVEFAQNTLSQMPHNSKNLSKQTAHDFLHLPQSKMLLNSLRKINLIIYFLLLE